MNEMRVNVSEMSMIVPYSRWLSNLCFLFICVIVSLQPFINFKVYYVNFAVLKN